MLKVSGLKIVIIQADFSMSHDLETN